MAISAREIHASSPIGIFDSGVGGLTVARTIIDQLPREAVTYIGDTLHAPYGPKTPEEVRGYSQSISDELVARGCKMIVIACNTASSVFLDQAQDRYEIPVLGVIEPAARRAVSVTRNGRIGVIGTTGTINSGAYQKAIGESDPSVNVTAIDCPQFVPFVERGITTGRQILGLAQAYLEPLVRAGVDTVVLGCTHYPLLSGVIQLTMGDDVTLVSSAEETAKDVFKTLVERDLLADEEALPSDLNPEVVAEAKPGLPLRVFESTGDPSRFARLATRFLGPAVTDVSLVRGAIR